MSDTKSQQEPTMEEILASIRRIISEDSEVSSATEQKEPLSPPARDPEPERKAEREPEPTMDEDVLELTQMVQEDGSIVNVDEEREAWPSPAASNPEPEMAREPVERPVEIRPMEPPARETADSPSPSLDEDLVSETVRTAASAALAQLAGSVKPRSSVALHSSGPTLEDIVRDMLKPMLREWLDENLPPLVERLVEREIEKMVRRAQGG